MDSTISPRLVTSLLALVFCLVASLRAGDTRPARMVTEVVAIALVSPRAAAHGSPDATGGGVLHLAASGGSTSGSVMPGTDPIDTSQPMGVAPPPVVVPPAPARPPRAQAPVRVARAPVTAKAHTASKARKRPVQPAPVTAQATARAPEVPAVFVPLRDLGLAIQTRLPPARRSAEPSARPGAPVRVANV